MMTLYQIAATIRKHGGDVWHVQHGQYGIILRSSLHGRQLRVAVRRPGDSSTPFPKETNSELVVPADLADLNRWLTESLQSKKG